MNPTGTERTLGRDVDREREEREDRVEVDRSMLVSKDERPKTSISLLLVNGERAEGWGQVALVIPCFSNSNCGQHHKP